MDALVNDLITLAQGWDSHAEQNDDDVDWAAGVRFCTQGLRTTLEKHKVGAWS
jgi:hypothetical protein